jgi:hypothetical protein
LAVFIFTYQFSAAHIQRAGKVGKIAFGQIHQLIVKIYFGCKTIYGIDHEVAFFADSFVTGISGFIRKFIQTVEISAD